MKLSWWALVSHHLALYSNWIVMKRKWKWKGYKKCLSQLLRERLNWVKSWLTEWLADLLPKHIHFRLHLPSTLFFPQSLHIPLPIATPSPNYLTFECEVLWAGLSLYILMFLYE